MTVVKDIVKDLMSPSPAIFSVGHPTRLQRLQGDWQAHGVAVFMKREDERDPLLGGNKWCKLQGWLMEARAAGLSRLVSVGGRWSNHLHALAHAGQRFGFETVGLVRAGDEPTPTLQDAAAAGMSLVPVSREEYRRRADPDWQAAMSRRFGPALFIPEGGLGEPARVGLAALAAELEAQLPGEVLLSLPVGSGATLAGLRRALPSRFHLVGWQVFADGSLSPRLAAQLGLPHEGPLAGHEGEGREGKGGWQLRETPAMRQHRRLPDGLVRFRPAFLREQGIPLDPVYTVRMMASLREALVAGDFAGVPTLVALHTGGLQGSRGHLARAA